MSEYCKNCSNKIKINFCSNCGQSKETHRLDWHYLLHEIQHGIFHFDKGFFHTVLQLFKRPGHTIREYLEGKRVKLFKPFAFCLLICTIFYIISDYSNTPTFLDDFLKGLNSGTHNHDTINDDNALLRTVNWLKSHYAYSSILLLPIISLASFIAFNKRGYNYIEHLIINAFLTGQRHILSIILLPITNTHNDSKTFLGEILENLHLICGMLLTFWMFVQFFKNKTVFSTIIWTIFHYILLVFLVIIVVFTLGLINEFMALALK
jgi:Protein of unknown function (DUF3667)